MKNFIGNTFEVVRSFAGIGQHRHWNRADDERLKVQRIAEETIDNLKASREVRFPAAALTLASIALADVVPFRHHEEVDFPISVAAGD